MTLDTRVLVLDEVDPHEVFHKCRELIGAEPSHVFYDRQDPDYRKGREVANPANPWTIANRIGQGLPAILDVSYRPGSPLRSEPEGCDEDCDEECSGDHPFGRACWLAISFDTAYGYRDDRGRGCGDLHADLVRELGEWLTAKGVTWEWINEFTFEVHQGPDELHQLGSGGREADTWFHTRALPAILADLAARQDGSS